MAVESLVPEAGQETIPVAAVAEPGKPALSAHEEARESFFPHIVRGAGTTAERPNGTGLPSSRFQGRFVTTPATL
jgi:hypothetical protein